VRLMAIYIHINYYVGTRVFLPVCRAVYLYYSILSIRDATADNVEPRRYRFVQYIMMMIMMTIDDDSDFLAYAARRSYTFFFK